MLPSDSMEIMKYNKGRFNISVEVESSLGSKYCLKICKSPSCTCTYKINKPRQVYKHIIWVLTNVLSLHQDDTVLQQIALTEAEVLPILLKAPDGLPENYRRKLIGSKPWPMWHLK